MNNKTDVLQHIKSGLTLDPTFASHILLVTLDKGSDHYEFFDRLANKSFEVKQVDNDEETKLQVKWQCIPAKTSSHVYWCKSIFNDRVVTECTKKILETIAQALDISLSFLVTTPLRFDKALPCEYACTTRFTINKES
jgi:hypothetical protein